MVIRSLKAFGLDIGKSGFKKERILFKDRSDAGIFKAATLSETETVHEVGNPTKLFGNRLLSTKHTLEVTLQKTAAVCGIRTLGHTADYSSNLRLMLHQIVFCPLPVESYSTRPGDQGTCVASPFLKRLLLGRALSSKFHECFPKSCFRSQLSLFHYIMLHAIFALSCLLQCFEKQQSIHDSLRVPRDQDISVMFSEEGSKETCYFCSDSTHTQSSVLWCFDTIPPLELHCGWELAFRPSCLKSLKS
mmetsp:Transcript_42565/g.76490  ORF Transcript_42565/g.76490 Transcript_42565/m.76490 type:complete len:247 (-) Transcript_42565:1122-1862(-)